MTDFNISQTSGARTAPNRSLLQFGSKSRTRTRDTRRSPAGHAGDGRPDRDEEHYRCEGTDLVGGGRDQKSERDTVKAEMRLNKVPIACDMAMLRQSLSVVPEVDHQCNKPDRNHP
jgi:hypothetical protein